MVDVDGVGWTSTLDDIFINVLNVRLWKKDRACGFVIDIYPDVHYFFRKLIIKYYFITSYLSAESQFARHRIGRCSLSRRIHAD